MSTKVLGNQHVTVMAGLASAIDDWSNPLLTELQALLNVSGAINWDSFDFNVKASDQKDDRTLTDGAGAQSRSPYTNFGGNLQFVNPDVLDTSSIFRQAKDMFYAPRVELVVAIRYGKSNALAPAAGDKWSVFHVITDIVAIGENDVSRYFQVSLVARDDCVVDHIVAPTVPVAITAAAKSATVHVGDYVFLSAAYQGWDITKAATWVSSDATKLVEVHPGIFKAVAVGAPTAKAQYPGATDSTGVAITISA